jgi:hypothetical protein
MSYDLEKNITIDVELRNSPEYQQCLEAINLLKKSGMVYEAAGNCIAMSELFQHSLKELGINSKLVECKLVLKEKRENGVLELKYIGFDLGSKNEDFIDTHVVVITETSIPMLIDLSISHMLPKGRVWVIERIVSNDVDTIAMIDLPDCKLTYSYKRTPKLLGLHQKNILQRLEDERDTKNKLNVIQKISFALIVFTFINFTLNMSLIGIKFTEITSGYFGAKH